MITKILGKGFHGPNISQQCSEKMFFSGDNRSGKTTRCNIVHLCLNGYVSSAHRVSKKAVDILNQYASDDSLTCAIEIDKTEFEFHISRDSKGKTSKRFRVDKRPHSEKEYMTELALAGNPKIIDLESFIQMSDAKKIDQLFKLYPAKVDIKKLNSDIADKESKINRIKADVKTKEAVIRENTKSKQAIELPAGTLADIKTGLADHVIAYRGTRDKIAGIEAAEKTKAEIKTSDAAYNQDAPVPSQTFTGANENPYADNSKPTSHDMGRAGASFGNKAHIESLQKILKVMESTGCALCVASMMIKKEINKCQKT